MYNINPKQTGRTFFHEAISLSSQKDYSGAIAAFEKAIALNPQNPVYHLFLGIAYYDWNKIDLALQGFEHAVDLSPANRMAASFHALCLLIQQQDIDRASAILDKYIDNAHIEFQARCLLFCESSLLKYKDNIALPLEDMLFRAWYLERKQVKIPVWADIWRRLGLALDRIFIFFSYIFRPGERAAYLNCLSGDSKLAQGNIEGATAFYHEALSILPYCDAAYDRLLDIYIHNKDYQAVFKYYEELTSGASLPSLFEEGDVDHQEMKPIEAWREHAPIISALAVSYYRLADYDKAEKLFRLIVTLYPDDYYHLYYLGLCRLIREDNADALVYFKLALSQRNNPGIARLRFEEMVRIMV
ncbi:MAG: tetratricopeptide repeat protein [Pseudomonadota bacterium]